MATRRQALVRCRAYEIQIEEHLEKLERHPENWAGPHWRREIMAGIRGLLPHLGRKTGGEWEARLEQWRVRLDRVERM